MTAKPRDPLLAAAMVATIAFRAVLVVGMIALGLGAGYLLLAFGGFAEQLAIQFSPQGLGETIGAILLIIAIAMIAIGLMFDFLTRLAQIIDTVGKGDPFTAKNAARLSRMGWLVVAIQVLTIPIVLLSVWLEPRIKDGSFHLDFELSPESILLALILFILARVFRQGTRMREELEGTV